MPTRDAKRGSCHEDEVKSLTAQISFLDEEIAVLRRRLAVLAPAGPAPRGQAARDRGQPHLAMSRTSGWPRPCGRRATRSSR